MQKTNTIVERVFRVDIARDAHDLRQAQRLRYDVFVAELGGDGEGVDHNARLEKDRYDAHASHLLLRDLARPDDDNVVGVYRVMSSDGAEAAGQFYCENEYDLSRLKASGGRLLELGRSCLHRDYRGGAGLMRLWAALSTYVNTHQIDILFGVASFHGTGLADKAAQLSLLHHHYLAPEMYRVHAIGPAAEPMDLMAADDLDTITAMRAMPPLIKAYLRLGGTVGSGAFVDHAFNTVDVCLILPTAVVSDKKRERLNKAARQNG